MAVEGYRPYHPIAVAARRLLGERPNLDALVGPIDKPRSTWFSGVLNPLDIVILNYNKLDPERLPEGLIHVPQAKAVTEKLPETFDLIHNGDKDTFYAFARVLQTMKPLMERAEQGLEEPYIGFHLNLKERDFRGYSIIDGTLQAYGLMAARLALGRGAPEAEQYALRGTFLDALIEVSTVVPQRDETIQYFIKERGWLDAQAPNGTYVFSDAVRQAAA